MRLQRTRLLSGGALLMAAGLFAACSPGSDGPLSPSKGGKAGTLTATPLSVTNTTWDFAEILIPGVAGPMDLGTDETISKLGDGSIVATAGPGAHVTVKGGNLPAGATERGLGLCLPTAASCVLPADGDEVGDGGPGTLELDFSGVLPAGSHLTAIELGSVQAGEGYRYSISTDGGATFGPAIERFDGDAESNAVIAFDLPTSGLVVRFEKTLDPNGECDPTCNNDYTVKSATTTLSTSDELLNGRMTGGGVKATSDAGDPVTLGLTLHCDILLSNNLEVNWGGHQWHLTKPITSSACSVDPNISAPPPASPINTFEGTGFGKLDGVGNSFVEFRFQDAGEPGSHDTVELTIYQPGSTSNVALHVSLQNLNVGNIQMHYDQPHGQKP